MPKKEKSSVPDDKKQSSITSFFSVTKVKKKKEDYKPEKGGKENDKTTEISREEREKKRRRRILLESSANWFKDDDGNVEKKSTGDDSSPIDDNYNPMEENSASQVDCNDSDDDTLSLCFEDDDGDDDNDGDGDDDTCQLSEIKKEKIRNQIEYYLSDENMKRDKFYRAKIISSPFGGGWFDLAHIVTAPRLQDMVLSPTDIVSALQSSTSVEMKKDATDPNINTYLIRRTYNRKLPKFLSHRPPKRRRYNHNNDYDYNNEYDGFNGGGSHGYTGYDCDRLLECGVKPWDDDAGQVLGALHDW